MTQKPKYSKEEHARRGEEIYEKVVRAMVESGNRGKIVAIDVETQEFEVAEDGLSAANHLFARLPNAQIWCERIGYPAVHRFGPRAAGMPA